MPQFVNMKDDTVDRNINDTTFDFDCLKIAIIRKASRLSGEIDRVTLGPDSKAEVTNSSEKENVQNPSIPFHTKKSNSPARSSNFHGNDISRSRITFSKKKILLENELLRKQEVNDVIRKKVQDMEKVGRDMREQMEILRSINLIKEEEDKAKELARLEEEEERKAELSELKRRQEQQQREKLEKEAEERRRKILEEKERLIKSLIPLRTNFVTKCQDIGTLSKNCKDKNNVVAVLTPRIAQLSELNRQMEIINERTRAGELTSADIDTAEMLVRQSEEVLNAARTEIERVNALYDAEIARREEEKKQAELRAQAEAARQEEELTVIEAVNVSESQNVEKQEEAVTPEDIVASQVKTQASDLPSETQLSDSPSISVESEECTTDDSNVYLTIDKESLRIYTSSLKFIDDYTAGFQEFLKWDSTKKFRLEYMKAISIPINTIAAAHVNPSHLTETYDKIQQFLMGKTSPSVMKHPQGVTFSKDKLAKEIVKQGETLISSKPNMAFALASISIALWKDYPDFGELLLAYFHKLCPYTIPLFLPKRNDQSDKDYYEALGYKCSKDGALEKEDQFLKRMSGLIRLYALIIVAKQRKGTTTPHPHSLQHAWRWLAATLNTEPRADMADICATLILGLLEVAGNNLWTVYPKQFPKLLFLLTTEYFPKLQNVGGVSGPLTRLEEFLRNTSMTGSIPVPEQQIRANFW